MQVGGKVGKEQLLFHINKFELVSKGTRDFFSKKKIMRTFSKERKTKWIIANDL